jgi:hypothetical protein
LTPVVHDQDHSSIAGRSAIGGVRSTKWKLRFMHRLSAITNAPMNVQNVLIAPAPPLSLTETSTVEISRVPRRLMAQSVPADREESVAHSGVILWVQSPANIYLAEIARLFF